MRLTTLARALLAVSWLLQAGLCAAFAQAPPSRQRYFIEFRARPSTYIGHTYILTYRVADGRVLDPRIAGLIPEEDVWNAVLSPVRASVREYKDDLRLSPTVIYRRELTAAQFDRVGRAVRILKATEHRWHAIFNNCNDFAIEIAEAIGLRRPPSLMPPAVWVATLRNLNGP